MIEEGSHSTQHTNRQSHTIKDKAWESWEWSVQLQMSGRSWLTSYVVSSKFIGPILKK